MKTPFSPAMRRSLLLAIGIWACTFHTPWAQSGDPLTIDRQGNVGIGTTNPAARLEVVGPVKFSGGDHTVLVDGRLGIGVTNPGSYRLWVDGDMGATSLYLTKQLSIGTTGLDAGAKMALKQDNTTWSIFPGYKDNSRQDYWTTLDILGNANLRVRDALSVEGSISSDALKSSGIGPVYADTNGKLVKMKNMVAYADKPDEILMPARGNKQLGFCPIDVVTNAIYLDEGDIVLITASFKFKWNDGSGRDEPRFGIDVHRPKYATLMITQSQYSEIIDDIWDVENPSKQKRNEYEMISFQMIHKATATGEHRFQLSIDNNTKANDNSTTADHVLVVTKLISAQ